jgi:TonB family protein
MLSRPIHSIPTETIPLGLFPTYCLSPDSTKLRVSFDLGSQAVFRNSLGTFQGKDVSTNVILRLADVIVAEAKVEKLMTFVPTEITFAPTPDLTAVFGRAARVSGGVIAGNILTKTQPVYPEIAKANHISGTVVLRAIIGRDGHVYSLHVMSGGDVSLAIAAIAAVREWTYKPYLLNGEPVEVDTTITVNFNLN